MAKVSPILDERFNTLTRVVYLDDGVSTSVDVRQLWVCITDGAVDPNGVSIRKVIVVAAATKRQSLLEI